MNLEQIINDKLGRKQLIAIVAILSLTAQPYVLAAVAALAIVSQTVLDWKHPRKNGNGEVKP